MTDVQSLERGPTRDPPPTSEPTEGRKLQPQLPKSLPSPFHQTTGFPLASVDKQSRSTLSFLMVIVRCAHKDVHVHTGSRRAL